MQCGQGMPRKVATRGQKTIAAEKHLKQCPDAAKTMKARFIRFKKQRKERGEGAVPSKAEAGKAKCLRSQSHEFCTSSSTVENGRRSKARAELCICLRIVRPFVGRALCSRLQRKIWRPQSTVATFEASWAAVEKWRQGHQATKYAETVNVTKEEAMFLESLTRGTVKPALQECIWFRSLCVDGDVESNP